MWESSAEHVGEKVGNPGALVIDSNHAALGVVRSLGRRGIPVWLIHTERTPTSFSRYVEHRTHWTEDDDRLGHLLDLAETADLRGWVLFPTDDRSGAFVARHHEALSGHFRLTTPPLENWERLHDKRHIHRLATALGLAVPQTWLPGNNGGLRTDNFPYPVILKPAVKETHNAFTDARAWRADTAEDLMALYDRASALVDPRTIMIQELIPGGGDANVSFAALCINGQPVASLCARRRRQYPIDFGQFSTYVETVVLPSLEISAERLLRAVHYTGMVELEYRQDPRSGQLKLVDVNPRAWGWNGLGRAAGIDFPYLQWRVATGRSVSSARGRAGVRWVMVKRDIQIACAKMLRGELSPLAYLWSLRPPIEHAHMATDDPAPVAADLGRTILQRLYR